MSGINCDAGCADAGQHNSRPERNGCAHFGQEFFLKRYFGYSDGHEDYSKDYSRDNCWMEDGYATVRKLCLRRVERGEELIITGYNWERNHVSVEKYFRATLRGIPIRGGRIALFDEDARRMMERTRDPFSKIQRYVRVEEDARKGPDVTRTLRARQTSRGNCCTFWNNKPHRGVVLALSEDEVWTTVKDVARMPHISLPLISQVSK